MSANTVKSKVKIDWRAALINPVLNKEFKLRMRSPRAMWALFFYLLAIGILAIGYLYITQMNGNQGRFNPSESRTMFQFISIVQLGLIAFMAPGLTAGVISGEREKQTLNLLLTTQQSSTTIILSKLISSLSFMLLITLATMPVYSIVFLYGGISPYQLLMVFLFYLFTMIALGSLGILFSTLFKRTMVSVIVTYGVTLALFGGTAFLFLVFNEVFENMNRGGTPIDYSWIGHLMGVNPVAALYSIFDPEFSRTVFQAGWTQANRQQNAPIQLWQEFIMVYSILIIGVVLLSISNIRPQLKRKKRS